MMTAGHPRRGGAAAAALRVWRVAVIVFACAGLLITGWGLELFTAQSNVIVVGYLVAAVAAGSERPPAPRLRGAVTAWIVLTGVANATLLDDRSFAQRIVDIATSPSAAGIGDLLLHVAVPAMMLIDWLAVRSAPPARWRDAPLWSVLPLSYLIVMGLRGLAGSEIADPYPYPFLDPGTAGWPGWPSGLPQMVLLAIAIPFAVVLLDRAARSITPHPSRIR